MRGESGNFSDQLSNDNEAVPMIAFPKLISHQLLFRWWFLLAKRKLHSQIRKITSNWIPLDAMSLVGE